MTQTQAATSARRRYIARVRHPWGTLMVSCVGTDEADARARIAAFEGCAPGDILTCEEQQP